LGENTYMQSQNPKQKIEWMNMNGKGTRSAIETYIKVACVDRR